jgi:hypothetical protein
MTKELLSVEEIDSAFNLARNNSFRPSFFIGCGGFGSITINQLKNRFNQFYDTGEPDPFPYARFFYIDTDTLEEGDLHKISLSGNPAEFYRLQAVTDSTFLSSGQVRKWFPRKEDYARLEECLYRVGDTGKGAGTCRPIGHLGLYNEGAAAALLQRFETILSSLYETAAGLGTDRSVQDRFGNEYSLRDPQKIYIYIISSLGGGTGTSNFVSIAALLRHLYQIKADRNEWSDRSCTMSMVLLTPGCIKDPSGGAEAVAANSYAALKELDTLLEMGSQYTVKFDNNLTISLKNDHPGRSLANHVFLMDNPRSNPANLLEKRIDIAELISDCLFQLSIGEIGNMFWSRNIDNRLAQEFYPPMASNNPEQRRTRYYSMGAAHYELPSGYLFARLAHDFVNKLVLEEQKNQAGEVPKEPMDTSLQDTFDKNNSYQPGMDDFFSTEDGRVWEDRFCFNQLKILLSDVPAELSGSKFFPYSRLTEETPEDVDDILTHGRKDFLDAIKKYFSSAIDDRLLSTSGNILQQEMENAINQFTVGLPSFVGNTKNQIEILKAIEDMVTSYIGQFEDELDAIRGAGDTISDLRNRRQENFEQMIKEIETWSFKGLFIKKDEFHELYRRTAGKWIGGGNWILPGREQGVILDKLEEFIDTDRELDLFEYRQKVFETVITILQKTIPKIKKMLNDLQSTYDMEWQRYRDEQLTKHRLQSLQFTTLKDAINEAVPIITNKLKDYRFDGSAFYTSFENTRFYPKRTHEKNLLEKIYHQLKAKIKKDGNTLKSFQNKVLKTLQKYQNNTAGPVTGSDLLQDLINDFKAALNIYDDTGSKLDWRKIQDKFGLNLDADEYFPHSAATATSEFANIVSFLKNCGAPFADFNEAPSEKRVWQYLVGPTETLSKIKHHNLLSGQYTPVNGMYPHQLSLYSIHVGFSPAQLKGLRSWYRDYCSQQYLGYPTHIMADAKKWPEPYVALPAMIEPAGLFHHLKNQKLLKAIGRTGYYYLNCPDTDGLQSHLLTLIHLQAAFMIDKEETYQVLLNELDGSPTKIPFSPASLPKTLPATDANTFSGSIWFCKPGAKTRYWIIPAGYKIRPLLSKKTCPLILIGQEGEWRTEIEKNYSFHAWCSRLLLHHAMQRRNLLEKTELVEELVEAGILSPVTQCQAEVFRNTYVER